MSSEPDFIPLEFIRRPLDEMVSRARAFYAEMSLRRTTRHLSHIFRTDARTFMVSFSDSLVRARDPGQHLGTVFCNQYRVFEVGGE